MCHTIDLSSNSSLYVQHVAILITNMRNFVTLLQNKRTDEHCNIKGASLMYKKQLIYTIPLGLVRIEVVLNTAS